MSRSKSFNNPFADARKKLEEDLRRAQAAEQEAARKTQAEAEAARRAAREAEEAAEAPDDASLFEQWVGRVTPLGPDAHGRVDVARRREPRIEADEDGEVLAVLADLVAGEGGFEIADTDEYVEGIAPGLDRRILARLRAGEFSVQAHLDLHGLTREEARLAVDRFVSDSRLRGRRCVLLVHGRGKNSPDREPVLKAATVRWLSRGSLGRQVLAFCTARRQDGGGGAMYVLLRK